MPSQILHVAGIVPIAGPSLDFNMPWNDSLMPIAPDYLAAERAVYECALAGCETIWVVCHIGTQPLLKKRLGEYIADPVSMSSGLNKSLRRRDISIYYVPVHPKDKDRRDSLSWSILYGADSAFRVSAFLSKWILPKKFYCSFPYGILPEKEIWKNRKKISSDEKTIFTFDNKSVLDNLHISFTFNFEDYKNARLFFKNKELDLWNKKNAIDYNLGEVFSGLKLIDDHTIKLPWFYDISTWGGYKNYISSDISNQIKKNNLSFLKDKRIKFPNKYEIDNEVSINKEKYVEDPQIPDSTEVL